MLLDLIYLGGFRGQISMRDCIAFVERKKFHCKLSKLSKMVALCHKRGTSAIRLPGATSIFNAELHAILLALDVV